MDSYFEKGVRFHGTLWIKGYVHFDGYFEGEIYSSNDFVVGKAGKVLGNIKTYNVTNQGNIQGNLFAENKVALIDESEAMLKKIRTKGNSVALESANKNYETKIFGPDRVKVQGVLVSLYRNF